MSDLEVEGMVSLVIFKKILLANTITFFTNKINRNLNKLFFNPLIISSLAVVYKKVNEQQGSHQWPCYFEIKDNSENASASWDQRHHAAAE